MKNVNELTKADFDKLDADIEAFLARRVLEENGLDTLYTDDTKPTNIINYLDAKAKLLAKKGL